MRDAIQEVLLWQTEYSSKVTDAMKRRGDLVKTELPNELRELLPELALRVGVDDLRAQGGDGSGSRTEIPWTRIYSQSRSPSATAGWYLVFLFSAAGAIVMGPAPGEAPCREKTARSRERFRPL